MITVRMGVATTDAAVPMRVTGGTEGIEMSVAAAYSAIEGEPYEGSYTFTPSAEEQRARTRGKVLYDDIVIEPIPQNYGLITYNGRIITVS